MVRQVWLKYCSGSIQTILQLNQLKSGLIPQGIISLRAINVHTIILHDNRATVYINEKYIKS